MTWKAKTAVKTMIRELGWGLLAAVFILTVLSMTYVVHGWVREPIRRFTKDPIITLETRVDALEGEVKELRSLIEADLD